MTGIRASRQGSSERPDEYQNFENALKKVLSVPHSEVKAKIESEKQERKLRKKVSSSAHASRAED